MTAMDRSRAARRRPTPAPGLPITAADLAARNSDAAAQADLERAAIVEQATAAVAGKDHPDGHTKD